MKILIINKFLYARGGDAISALATGKLLESKGHQVIFWGMNHPLTPEYPKKNLFVDYINYDANVGPLMKLRMARNILYSFEAKKKIRRLIEEEKPDIVHLHNFAHQISPSILDVFGKYNIPVVMTMHDYKLVCPAYTMSLNGKLCEKCRNGGFYHCLSNKCIKNSYIKSMLNSAEMYLHHRILHIYDNMDRYIAPSQFIRDKIKNMGFKGDIIYLPNFIDTNDFTPSYGWEGNSIVYLGRLSTEKGLTTLIQSMKGVRNFSLNIIGDGPIKDELEMQARTVSNGNIRFLGYKSEQELKEEIRSSMFVILPSECYENCPRSILEAFAMGKPVIGADIGGIPELVKDRRSGYLFKSGDVNDLRDKITMLARRPNKIIEMGKAARASVEQLYGAQQHYERLMEVYKSAKKGKGTK